jgi:Tfp pilus assembly pilus retraction ATPase PilT
MQTGSQYGMLTMNTAIKDLYLSGRIGKDTAMSWSIDKEDMQRQLAVYNT